MYAKLVIASTLVVGLAGPVAAEEEQRSVSATAAVGWTTQYFFRGIVQETEGLILQPSLEASWALVDGEEWELLSELKLTLGSWNSFHTGKTGSDSDGATDPRSFYESDLYAKLSFEVLSKVTLETMYTAYLSPNTVFATIHELAFSLGYDDQQLYEDMMGGRFAGLQPSATVALELEGGGIGKKGSYLELALQPAFKVVDAQELSLTATVPLAIGLGLSDYYDDGAGDNDTFGFFSAGATLGLGLGFMPARLGSWELSFGAQLLVLGRLMEQANNGNGVVGIASSALSCSI